MSYSIEIRPLTTIEIIEAFDWYELQRSGLGLDFLNELENFYHYVQGNPAIILTMKNPLAKVK